MTHKNKTEVKSREKKAPLFKYELPGHWRVCAGKSDEDNEYLTLKLSRPKDYWFHVRGVPGSHVILRAKDDEEPDRETLKRAAAIAAYHSKARKGGVVAVSYTRAQNVTKARGEKTGTVRIKKEAVLKVRPGLFDLTEIKEECPD